MKLFSEKSTTMPHSSEKVRMAVLLDSISFFCLGMIFMLDTMAPLARAKAVYFGRGVSEDAVISLSLSAHPDSGCVLMVAKNATAVRSGIGKLSAAPLLSLVTDLPVGDAYRAEHVKPGGRQSYLIPTLTGIEAEGTPMLKSAATEMLSQGSTPIMAEVPAFSRSPANAQGVAVLADANTAGAEPGTSDQLPEDTAHDDGSGAFDGGAR